MRAAFVILAHERFDRVGELARFLSAHDATVVVHIDRQVGPSALEDARGLIGDAATVISTQRTLWGRMGLVDATLDAVRHVLTGTNHFSHVCLLSGSCLPIRPLADLDALLSANAGTDFIESVPAAAADWVEDGLSEERFTLWHGFSWRHQRWLFDRSVGLQRRLGVRRTMPKGLVPHLGLQWWCLSRETLERLLALPELDVYRRFFRSTWIPDEGFFQTLVRAHGVGRIETRPLTLQRFDMLGRPFVFHDDHRNLLGFADDFFARKIDPDAEGLYRHFLDPLATSAPRSAVDPSPFAAARAGFGQETRCAVMPGRWPSGTTAFRIVTAHPYVVFVGDDAERLRELRMALTELDADLFIHGRLFGEKDAEFADQSDLYIGNLSCRAALRNHRPAQFLRQVLWSDRTGRTAFFFHIADDDQVKAQLCRDPNARLVLVGDRSVDDVINNLRRPPPLKSGRPRRRAVMSEFISWIHVLPGDDVAADQDAARDILCSDWHDPSNWITPQQRARA